MTNSDPAPSSIRDDSICEPSLPPNKSSGDIGERLVSRADFFLAEEAMIASDLGVDVEKAGVVSSYRNSDALLDKEAAAEIERRDRLISAHQQQIIDGSAMLAAKDAEIERLRREVENLQRALLFWMPGVDLRLDEATRELAAKDAALLAGYTGPTDGPCWGDGMLDRAISAEFAAAKGRGEPKPYGYVVPYFGTHLFFLPKEKDVAGFYGRAGAEVVTVYAADKIEQERPRLRSPRCCFKEDGRKRRFPFKMQKEKSR